MCNFLSAIYIRRSEGAYDLLSAPGKTDSHSELERMFKLNHKKDEHYVKVEFIPDYTNIADLTKWRFVLDEERRPEWFDDDREQDCKEALESLVRSFLKTEGEREVRGDDFLLACGTASITAEDQSTVIARDQSKVTAKGQSTVTARGQAEVIARDQSRVTAWGQSTVTAWDSSTVTAWDRSTVTARDSSKVTAWDSSTVTARDSSTVTAWDRSTVTARDSSTVTAWDRSTVITLELWGSGAVEVSGQATWVNHRDKKVVVPSGYSVEVCV